ncbi:MAG: CocE/NonD family hydrolase [Rhodospirillaceae bacterium]|nr:CocE/NonD family hydrolase [Rhodospirillaceae bacterium]
MKVVEDLPRAVRELATVWIVLADGCRLAARLWLPADAESAPVPALLEYLPYRRGDATAVRDAQTHRYLAGHGYACLRVDMRGCGDSDGLLHDEYLAQEQDDAIEVIAWIARQPWCTGAVGMFGTSWGGFNALQVAARRPPALMAIIAVCATDDRYADDTHYMGGCLLNGNLGWASSMFAFCSRPPDPAVVGERWRSMWRERLENIPLLVETWTRHQHRDAYWRHGSVCEDYGAIACPVYAVGGWADAYTNAIPRLLAGLKVPRKGLIGPWAHAYPHMAVPGPAIGFLQECLRWWDHWLKGLDTAAMAEPMLRVWMQDGVPPAPSHETRPGRWVAEPVWPSPNVAMREFVLSPGGLDEKPGPEMPLVLSSPQSTGRAGGAWCPYGYAGDMPLDQRIDDAFSLTFDSAALDGGIEILGAPVVALDLAGDRSNGLIAIRLSDVAGDGAATRVSYGLLNLTHREGHERPIPLEPGRRYTVRLRLNDCAHSFAVGRKIRISISTAYWPTAWPSPEPVTLTVFAGAGRLHLPVRPRRPEDSTLPAFAEPEAAAPLAHETLRPPQRRREPARDIVSGASTLIAYLDRGAEHLPDSGLTHDSKTVLHHRIHDGDPLSAEIEAASTYRMERGSWRISTETRTRFSSTRDAFVVSATLEAFEGETEVFRRVWESRIPRQGV